MLVFALLQVKFRPKQNDIYVWSKLTLHNFLYETQQLFLGLFFQCRFAGKVVGVLKNVKIEVILG